MKGVEHALDHICDSLHSMAGGIDNQPHDGRVHSYPACHRHRCYAGQGHSGTQTSVTILTLTGAGERCLQKRVTDFGNAVRASNEPRLPFEFL